MGRRTGMKSLWRSLSYSVTLFRKSFHSTNLSKIVFFDYMSISNRSFGMLWRRDRSSSSDSRRTPSMPGRGRPRDCSGWLSGTRRSETDGVLFPSKSSFAVPSSNWKGFLWTRTVQLKKNRLTGYQRISVWWYFCSCFLGSCSTISWIPERNSNSPNRVSGSVIKYRKRGRTLARQLRNVSHIFSFFVSSLLSFFWNQYSLKFSTIFTACLNWKRYKNKEKDPHPNPGYSGRNHGEGWSSSPRSK